jgi:hypothetical protein
MGESRQKIRGSTADLDAALGLVGLLAYDMSTNDLRVYDGINVGGKKILNRDNTIALIASSAVTAYNSARLNGQLATFYAQSARSIAVGNGLTGGGDLTANRTIALATPGTISPTSTNAATASSHTHALSLVAADLNTIYGFTPANSANSIVAGNGLSGGGTLAASRTLALATPGTVTVSSTNAVTASSHTHALTLTPADIGAASSSTLIDSGNGLTGGGTLAANRTISLGTPGTISGTTTNIVTATSHSHALFLGQSDITDALTYVPANNANSVIAGNGLTGGGTLAATRTISLGTPATLSASSTNAVAATSHTHFLNLDEAAIAGYLGYYPPNRNNQIIAGDGMTGGGTIAASRTITMGVPTSVTNYSTNIVYTTSHSHALGFTAAEVYLGSNANLTSAPLGHIVAVYTGGAVFNRNSIVRPCLSAGDSQWYYQFGLPGAATEMSGTWRARGQLSGEVVLAQKCAD